MSSDLRLAGAKIPAALYRRLDAYWHRHRMHSRSDAIREAIELLLAERPVDRAWRKEQEAQTKR
jgi:metal-responsive CopG/Arc/MetJ family transcriptional regulator